MQTLTEVAIEKGSMKIFLDYFPLESDDWSNRNAVGKRWPTQPAMAIEKPTDIFRVR
jgi:hypothetical protein